MERKEIVAQLLKEGAKQIKDVTIKNVTVTPMEEYVRLGLTLDTEVDGYRINDNKEYEAVKTNVIFVSAYTIATLLKDDDNAAFAANHLLNHHDALSVVLSRAKITIVQEQVVSGQEYKNPFASEKAKTTIFDHDTIVNHVTSLTLGEFGLNRLDRLADKMMGF